MSPNSQARPVFVPDIDPATTLGGAASFSMTAGDFLECYTDKGDLVRCILFVFFFHPDSVILAW